MISIKSSRKSLRLLTDEEDSLLAGVDFQTYYLGRKEVQIDYSDLDTVVEGIYLQCMDNGELNNSIQFTITVDTNQLIFRDVVSHHIEFIIALTSVKSVYCANKKTKYPNAVIIVCCLPSRTTATVHVLHCLNPSQAREFYNAINRAFDYNGVPDSKDVSSQVTKEKITAFGKANKDIEANAVSGCKVNTPKSTKHRESNAVVAKAKGKQANDHENTGLLGAEVSFDKHEEYAKPVKEMPQIENETPIRLRTRAKTVPQTKGAEERGLLDNIDSDDAFDDEFTDLARNRSSSNNIKTRFGR